MNSFHFSGLKGLAGPVSLYFRVFWEREGAGREVLRNVRANFRSDPKSSCCSLGRDLGRRPPRSLPTRLSQRCFLAWWHGGLVVKKLTSHSEG